MYRYSILSICCLLLVNCGKKGSNSNQNPGNTSPNVSCKTPANVISVNNTDYAIIKDTAFSTDNQTYYLQIECDSMRGCGIHFQGTQFPDVGTFTITPKFTEVQLSSSKTYLQYFHNGQSYIAQSGILTIKKQISSQPEFCKIKFTNTIGDEFEISMKAIIN